MVQRLDPPLTKQQIIDLLNASDDNVRTNLRENLHSTYIRPNKFRLGRMERFLAFVALLGSILLLTVQLIHWE